MSVYEGHGVTLHHADCLDVLRTLPDASVDSVVTDPPYGLEFMGKDWDAPWKQGADVHAEARTRRADEMTDESKRRYIASSVNKYAAGLPFQRWCELWAAECLRVLKPGGHLLAFGGTRTWHRLACAVEDAGFEVRDSIAWMYGSGFPKSLDVSKAIDKQRHEDRGPMLAVRAWLNAQRLAAGVTLGQINAAFGLATNGGGNASNWTTHPTNIEVPSWEKWEVLRALIGFGTDMDAEVWRLNGRKGKPGEAWQTAEVIGVREGAMAGWSMDGATKFVTREDKAANSDAAQQWAGWGTALKPAFEPIVVARKPLTGTVAQSVLTHGTGALNIDGCRVTGATGLQRPERRGKGETGGWANYEQAPGQYGTPDGLGRWPANVVLDEEMARRLDEQSGEQRDGTAVKRNRSEDGRAPYDASSYMITDRSREDHGYGGQGGASRFFPTFRYEAKAPTSERPRYKREGGSDNATTYGQMKKRECNVCGNRTCPAGGEQSGKPWPTCGHDDWSWVEQQSARDEFVSHPTVKPLDLMRWLVRLVTPPGGTVLEPFAGSGTTVEACIIEGFQCIAIEREADYLPLIRQRIDRRRDPVEALRGQAADLGLFDLLGGEGA